MGTDLAISGLEAVGSIVGIMLAGYLWFRKLRPSFAVDDKLAAVAQADTGIIERLGKEADRLSKQNDLLAVQLNKLQIELLNLSSENNKLQHEISALRAENVDLRKELRELSATISSKR